MSGYKKSTVSEKRKHSLIGVLILIPSALAFISMTYAISTLIDNPYVSGFFGLLWAGAIFSIDRFIVSSFRKSEKLSDDIKKGSFWIRMALAVIFGIAVSHPFVLYFFDESISEKIQVSLKENVNKEIIKTDKKKDVISNKIEAVQNKLKDKRSRIDCLIKLLTAEQSGNKVFLECGSSSGHLRYGVRSRKLEDLIEYEKRELDSIKKEIKPQVDEYLSQIKRCDSILTITIKSLKKNLSNDYLARTKALAELEDGINGGTVSRDIWFIIALFLSIDLTCVLLKVFTPRGPYDDLLEEQEIMFRYEFKKNKEIGKLRVDSEIEFYNIDGIKFHKTFLSEKSEQNFIKKSIKKKLKSEANFYHKIAKEMMKFGNFFTEEVKKINKIKSKIAKKEELYILITLKKSFFEKLKEAIKINKT